MEISKKQELIGKIDKFISLNRKICWEAEFERGEYCIGEKAVINFIKEIYEK